MSNPINKNINNLNELLDHLDKDQTELDAFEKEALEGFASLNSKEEAVELKLKLDERFNKEIKAKRKPFVIYWSAAAGIVLLIGLFFIFRSFNTSEEKEMAQNISTVPEFKPMENVPGSIMNEPSTDDKTAESRNKESNSPTLDQRVQTNEQSLLREKNKEKADGYIQNQNNLGGGSGNAAAKTYEKGGELDDMVSNTKAEIQEIPAAESKPQIAQNNENNLSEGESDKKNLEKSSAKARSVIETKKKESKRNEPAAPAAYGAKDEESVKTSADLDAGKINADLVISKEELNKQIHDFLKDKKYNASFNCILSIKNNEVVDVLFENNSLFRKSEQKELTKFLKSLKVFNSKGNNSVSKYFLNYKAE